METYKEMKESLIQTEEDYKKELNKIIESAGYFKVRKNGFIEQIKGVGEITKTETILNAHTSLTNVKEKDIVSYGYSFIDDKLLGIFPGDLVLIGSEAGGGKTTFVNHIATSTARQNKKVAVFSLEDHPDNIALNSIYFEINRLREAEGKSAFPYKAYRFNKIKNLDYWYDKAFRSLKQDNIVFQRNVDGSIMKERDLISQIEAIANDYDLFIIDHLHYVDFEKTRNRQEEIEAFMKKLSALVQHKKLRVVLVAHYKKLGGARPTDESFKDSQAIPHNATTTIHIWRDRTIEQEDTEDNEQLTNFNELQKYETEFYIQKSRMPFGTGSIKARFNPTTNNYYNESSWNSGSIPTEDRNLGEQDKLIY